MTFVCIRTVMELLLKNEGGGAFMLFGAITNFDKKVVQDPQIIKEIHFKTFEHIKKANNL